ncbi:MAG: hypothetical protein MZV64_09465 [Ignavibacteriales bacterium]|nr:hypothetical protein [Ignavibacteriales bacterium]
MTSCPPPGGYLYILSDDNTRIPRVRARSPSRCGTSFTLGLNLLTDGISEFTFSNLFLFRQSLRLQGVPHPGPDRCDLRG